MMFPLCSSSRHQQGRGNANVKVVVRLRPLNDAELSEKYHTVTEAISDHMLVFDPKVQSAPGFLPTHQRDMNRRRYKDLKYAFDYVFGPTATNKDVFEQTTKGIVSGVLNGYNCSVFAYGATGAGKTHTMLGNEREPGVIYHTMIDLYRRINEQMNEKMFDVAISYSEVYNEQVRDLLMPRGNLPIREDKTVGVIIAGLSLHKPKTADELLHMLHFGNKNRTQHPTDANAESSRSHAVFQVFVNQRDKSASVSTEVKMAKMCLVDLAGSERANHTTNRGERFREGANINRSLLALGNVINALADNKFKGHIPYRDSKLTRLLKDSLGGNCQTVMIAAVSPSSRSFEDTYNTLRYADRAKHIRADLKKNVMSVDFHIANYKKYVQELEKENQELRKAKQKLMESLEKVESVNTPASSSPIIRQFQERLKDLFKTRKDIRKAQMESEGAKRELKWKVARKEQAIKRVQQLTGAQTVIGKHKRVIERMKRRIAKEEQALKDSSHRVQAQDTAIYDTCSEISSILANGRQHSELLDFNVRIHTIESNLYDSHMYLAFVKKMARAQERQSSVNERLISCLLQLVKKQHDILHSQDLLNSELKSKYEQCCYLVEERGVAWTSPAATQDVTSSTKAGEEDEELCISDIIDIQIPKLHMNALWSDSPSKSRTDIFPQLQPPQRVGKAASALKPASRVPAGQYLSCGDKGTKPSSSPTNYTKDSGDQLRQPPVARSTPDGGPSPETAGMNAVEILNASLDMCPKRRGLTPGRSGQIPRTTTSACGISFGSNKPVNSQTGDSENLGNTQAGQAGATAGHYKKLFTSSSMPDIEREPALQAKRSLWRNFSQPEVSSTKAQFDPLPQTEQASKEDENSSTDNLNDTFQVFKPALPNTPCIDSSKRHSHIMETSTPQLIGLRSQLRNTPHLTRMKQHSLERPAPLQKLDFLADVKNEAVSRHSPVTKHQTKSSGSSANSWTSASNPRRSSLDMAPRYSPNKTKTVPSQAATIKPSVRSPVGFNRHSPSSVSSVVTANSHPSNISGNNAQDSPETQDRQQRPGALSCINSNNANTAGTGLTTSPKSYADAVKSPVFNKANIDSGCAPTPQMSNRVGEAVMGAVMITPDFSRSCQMNVPPPIPPSWVEAHKPKINGDTGSGDVRQPLRVLSTNTSSIRSPLSKSSSSTLQRSSSESSDLGGRTYKSLKLKVLPASKGKRYRALASEPYNVQQHKRQRFPSTKEPSVPDLTSSSEVSVTCRPSYMQPTFARVQKMLGLGRDRLLHREANNPLSRRTVLHRQTSSTSLNKTANPTETTWRL